MHTKQITALEQNELNVQQKSAKSVMTEKENFVEMNDRVIVGIRGFGIKTRN